jgi:hypothetical protein
MIDDRKQIDKIQQELEESNTLFFHHHFSGLNNEQLKDSGNMRRLITFKAFAFTGFLINSFTAFVQFKNKNRFKNYISRLFQYIQKSLHSFYQVYF